LCPTLAGEEPDAAAGDERDAFIYRVELDSGDGG